jgi:hypothetical protein
MVLLHEHPDFDLKYRRPSYVKISDLKNPKRVGSVLSKAVAVEFEWNLNGFQNLFSYFGRIFTENANQRVDDRCRIY